MKPTFKKLNISKKKTLKYGLSQTNIVNQMNALYANPGDIIAMMICLGDSLAHYLKLKCHRSA